MVAAATASVFHATLRLKMRSMSFTAGEVEISYTIVIFIRYRSIIYKEKMLRRFVNL